MNFHFLFQFIIPKFTTVIQPAATENSGFMRRFKGWEWSSLLS